MKIIILSLITIFLLKKDTTKSSYTFDSFIEYTNNQNNVIDFFLFNSSDTTYYFSGSSYSMEGSLIDYKNNTSHKFEIHKKLNDIAFQYIESNKTKAIEKNHTFATYYYEKEEKKVNQSKQLTIFAYSNKKNKKIKKTIEVIYDESNFKLNESFLSRCAHLRLENANFKITFPYPSKITIKQKNFKDHIFKISPKKDINTQLYIPN
jgi:hypothetical protein